MAKLGVNIDHVATLREARRTVAPDPVNAAIICEKAGANSIVCHLREDRRHIKDEDVIRMRKVISTRLNLEMSVAKDIVDFACKIRPDQATIVPEKRREVTTEGGLDVSGNLKKIKQVVSRLEGRGVSVSLFIDPVKVEIDASIKSGAKIIELHTGEYANAATLSSRRRELKVLKSAVEYALFKGLEVNAGHGLDYANIADVAMVSGISEFNIGHSIISRAIFVGMAKAVEEMAGLIR